jgi:hypothetical protein
VSVSAKLFDQLSSRGRHRNSAGKNFMAVYIVAIHGFVGLTPAKMPLDRE